MARGLPAVWSTALGLIFGVVGIYLYVGQSTHPSLFGAPFILFGLFIIIIGAYVHFVAAPEPPSIQQDETIIETRSPTQKVAFLKIAVSLPILLVAIYLLFFTLVPYVYPIVTLLLGLYLLSSGLLTYWKNTLTTYYVTTERVIKAYRFISLIQQEVPLNKVRGVEERRSFTETLVGLGNIRIASGGGGGTLEVVVKNIENSTDFADEIRNLL
ncbi:PH domain-containing protein [Haloarcula hispanica]|uniref:PH domain-containing protein n=1 Tax=Haloarcula hispanica TaxID=51589 RepID=A0A5J5LGP7_HALHI|nr:PH domain-containing protein [Haloarcula hispanica]KAA9408824.1 PH domain-containing protein [Haloarcula hispanica]